MKNKSQRLKDLELLKERRERLRVVADVVLDSVETLDKPTTAIETTRMARLVITTDKMLNQLYLPMQSGTNRRMTIEEVEALEGVDDDPDNEDWKQEIQDIFDRINAQRDYEEEYQAQVATCMEAYGPKDQATPENEPPKPQPPTDNDFDNIPRIRTFW